MNGKAIENLNKRIQHFYDASSGLWEETWGEHMHHGYYGPDGSEPRDHRQAQIDLIEELLAWGGVSACRKFLDVGCGIGGSSIHLAKKFSAAGQGITLSPIQANRANQRAAAAGLQKLLRFEVADALAPPFPAGSFDLLWSLESAEHIPEKERFLKTCWQQLRPGGIFLMATWCHRPTPPDLGTKEKRHLAKLYRAYHLPEMISIDDYRAIAENIGLQNIRIADWTAAVRPFWKAVVKSALHSKAIAGLLNSGWSTIKGAWAMKYMIQGYKSGLIRFALLRGEKR